MRKVTGWLIGIGLAALAAGAIVVNAPEQFGLERFFADGEQWSIVRQRRGNAAQAAASVALPGTPKLDALDERLAAHAVTAGAPVLIRIFKKEFELELWMARDGRYHKFATYPICSWSGRLGPKFVTGDRQAPEGFYTVGPSQMNPNSRWHKSFNVGFPNTFDAARGRTGSALMVHGGCSSAGCYAMTNPVIDEIWKLTSAALASGKQKRFQVQIFPFRLSEEALAQHANSPHIAFWRQLKLGFDLFETTQLPPAVGVCERGYQFKAGRTLEALPPNTANCPQGAAAITEHTKKSL